MTRNEAIEKIMERIEEIKDEYDFGYIGVRVQEDAFVLGEMLNNSFAWVDGEMTEAVSYTHLTLPTICSV